MCCTDLQDEKRATHLLFSGSWPFQGKVLSTCRLCNQQIAIGSDTFPFEGLRWVHLSCAKQRAAAAGQPLVPPVCKHWQQRGFCLYKEKCVYRHPALEALPATSVWPARKPQVAQPAEGPRKFGHRCTVRKGFRTGAFRRFLLDTFGHKVMASGSGVLDVAGGKGELSFELVNLNSIQATVVDPRPLQLDRFQKCLKAGFYHRNRLFQQWVSCPHSAISNQGYGEAPAHLRMVLNADVIACLVEGQAEVVGKADASQPALSAISGVSGAVDSTQRVDAALCPTATCTACDSAQPEGSSDGAPQTCDPAQLDQCRAQPGGCSEEPALSSSFASMHCSEFGSSRQIGSGGGGWHAGSSEPCSGSNTAAGTGPHRSAFGLPALKDWREVFVDSMRDALQPKWTHRGRTEHEGDWTEPAEECKPEALPAACGAELPATLDHVDHAVLETARATLRNCSVLVGMHPDQAVEYIVEYARLSRKPFAVVPCCVHFQEFPWRRLPDGTPVRAPSQLVDYLVALDPEHIRVAELPIEGRNKVVFCTSWDS